MQESEIPVLSIAERIIQKIESYCNEEAMVRLNLEGPITREQYHLLDLRGVWLYGQQRAFSFEIDESRLILINDLSQARVERANASHRVKCWKPSPRNGWKRLKHRIDEIY